MFRSNMNLEESPQTKFIAANGVDDPLWHLGLRRDMRGARTGTLRHVWYVTACSGRQLGGPWGQSTTTEQPTHLCSRCAKLWEKLKTKI